MKVSISPRTDRPTTSRLMKYFVDFMREREFLYDGLDGEFVKDGLKSSEAAALLGELFERLANAEDIGDFSTVKVEMKNEASSPIIESEY